MVLGIGIAAGEGVSVGLLAAIFVSNLPEAIGGATTCARQMHNRRKVLLNWVWIAGVLRARDGGGLRDRRHRVATTLRAASTASPPAR